VVLVVAPSAVDEFTAFMTTRAEPIELAVQLAATGMLDAITAAAPAVERHRPGRVVVTWCDQIAVSPLTVRRLYQRAMATDAPALVLPTIEMSGPYIHFDRELGGRIVRVLERREGDPMPARGEADLGLFDMALDVYLQDLLAFARETQPASATGERNFLPFVPWLAARASVETIAGISPMEAVGINTPQDLAVVQAYLASQDHGGSALGTE
jgi:hypothetical protein